MEQQPPQRLLPSDTTDVCRGLLFIKLQLYYVDKILIFHTGGMNPDLCESHKFHNNKLLKVKQYVIYQIVS